MNPESSLVEIDKSDPNNIINMVPQKIQEHIEKLYVDHPEYLGASEEVMYKITQPDSRTELLRIAFWEEFFRAKAKGNKMQMNWVWGDLVQSKNFYRDFLGDQTRLAWIMTPMTERMLSYKASLDVARQKLRTLLRMDLTGEDGKIDTKRAAVFLKAYELVETRTHGAVVQRIDSRTQVINTKETEALEKKIESMQEKLLEEVSPVIAIEGVSSEDK